MSIRAQKCQHIPGERFLSKPKTKKKKASVIYLLLLAMTTQYIMHQNKHKCWQRYRPLVKSWCWYWIDTLVLFSNFSIQPDELK